jgi:hypothetical protein
MTAPKPDVPCQPRGLRHDMAAAYVGVSPSKFDEWVKRGIMPRPKRQDSITIWDRRALDTAFDDLNDDNQQKGWTE